MTGSGHGHELVLTLHRFEGSMLAFFSSGNACIFGWNYLSAYCRVMGR